MLYWITEGKTNPEIAINLDASPETVKKQAANISTQSFRADSDLSGKMCAFNSVARVLSTRTTPRK